MNNSKQIVMVAATSLVLAAAASTALAAQPDPRIDLGNRFEVRLQNSVDRGGKKPVGTSTLMLGFHVENGNSSDSIRVTLAQHGKTLTTATCKPKPATQATRCESEAIAARTIKISEPVKVRFVYENTTTDATTELLALELEVLAARDWVGNQGSKPQHVEHRHLRMDGALGLFLLEDSSDSTTYDRKKSAYLRLWYWDAQSESKKGTWSLRCQIDGGEWTGTKIGKPSPSHGPDVKIQNRVWSRKTRDAVTETLSYQRFAFNANMPFSVAGARPIDEPDAVDGAWRCQLRRAGDAGQVTVRELAFVVKGNVAQPHAAQSEIHLGAKRVAVTVSLGDEAPAAFDPEQITHPYGVTATIPGLVSGAPKKRITPRFSK